VRCVAPLSEALPDLPSFQNCGTPRVLVRKAYYLAGLNYLRVHVSRFGIGR
jgi:hypothetical protein